MPHAGYPQQDLIDTYDTLRSVCTDACDQKMALLVGGELHHSSARLLEARGWGLLVDYESQEAAALTEGEAVTSRVSPATARSIGGTSPAARMLCLPHARHNLGIVWRSPTPRQSERALYHPCR